MERVTKKRRSTRWQLEEREARVKAWMYDNARGRANAKRAEDVAAAVGCTRNEARYVLNAWRACISQVLGRGGGYFLPANADEVAQACKELEKKAAAEIETAKKWRAAYGLKAAPKGAKSGGA